MNVAIDARYIEPHMDGFTRYTLNLLRGLAEVGPPRRIIVLVSDPAIIPEDLRRAPCFDFVVLRRNPRGLFEQMIMPRMLRRLGVRLLHSPDAFSPLPSGCRKVITIHDLIPIVCRDKLWRSVKARWWRIWRAWLRAQTVAADRVITSSRHSAGDLRKWLRVPDGKLRVIYIGINVPSDAAIGAVPAHDGGPVILYVGRRDPYKNVVGLVRAFDLLRRGNARARLAIVGRPSRHYPEAEREVEKLALGDGIEFVDSAEDASLAARYRAADIFAFPSYYEGFGLPPLEAMAHGVPVVASNRSSLPEVLGDAAIYFDPDDVPAMAAAMAKVLSDTSLADRLRTLGRARAGEYTVKKQAIETLAVYEELLARRK